MESEGERDIEALFDSGLVVGQLELLVEFGAGLIEDSGEPEDRFDRIVRLVGEVQ